MNTTLPVRRELGVAAGLEPGVARELAARCEDLGYHSLWSNDEPTASGLETLAQFAATARRLELGVGVLPLDRHPPVRIAAEVARLELDPTKLWIGIGSGQLTNPTEAMQAVAELRRLLPGTARIVVAAMRPRICRIGGAVAYAILLNWMLPAQAAVARRWVQEGAGDVRSTRLPSRDGREKAAMSFVPVRKALPLSRRPSRELVVTPIDSSDSITMRPRTEVPPGR